MQVNSVDKNSPEYLQNKLSSARHTLLLVVIFTVINLVLLLCDGQTYFLFSASVPYYLTIFGMLMDAGAGGSIFTVTALVIAAICLAAYLLCWLLCKKRIGWYVVAMVLFILDTVMLLWMSVSQEILTDNVIDLLIHGWVLVELVQALRAHKKRKAMPVPVPEAGPAMAATPEADFSNVPEDAIPDDSI